MDPSSAAAAPSETYARTIADRIEAQRFELARAWLDELKVLLPVNVGQVFPTDALLDHIPTLIGDIASFLRAPEAEEIAANTAVTEKAKELGTLRHAQHASVHQLLREYELLSDTLEAFVAAETARLGLTPSPADCFDAMRRLVRAVLALMRTTVDTFVAAYVETIDTQTDQFRRFTRIASHELRSPIGTIVFAADLLKKGEQDTSRRERLLEIVDTNAHRLRHLVTTLQRVVQLEPSVNAPNEQVIEVGALAQDVARQLAEMAEARGITIRIDPNLPVLFLDPARLELVLVNLLSNAIKYADVAKADRYVELALVNQGGTTCTLVVRDNGLGISEEAQARIFQRHFRAHGELDELLGNDGSGLGLSIVAECIEGLRARIRCESQPGDGTSMFIDLPFSQEDPNAASG